MIVEALLGLVAWILDILLFPLDIQEIPQTTAEVFLEIVSYLTKGAQIVHAFLGSNSAYIVALLGFVISFNAVLALFDLIMWILKKIPFINIH